MIHPSAVLASTTDVRRRLLLPLLLMIAIAFGLSALVVLRVGRTVDEAARVQTERSVTAALRAHSREVERTIRDYAAWGDAYRNLHASVDRTWAYDERNLGPTLFAQFSVDVVLVVAPDGRIAYAVVDGALSDDPYVYLQGGLAEMVAAAREVPADTTRVVSGILRGGDGDVAVAAAAALSTGGDPTVTAVPGTPSVLVFADRLAVPDLAALGERAIVADLRGPSGAPDGEGTVRMALPTFDGASGPVLRWEAPQPGRGMLGAVLPWLALAALCWIALTVAVVRNGVRGAVRDKGAWLAETLAAEAEAGAEADPPRRPRAERTPRPS